MSEENNHAEVKGSVAGQSFSVSTKEIIPLLLLVGGFIAGYLIFLSITHEMESLEIRQKEAIAVMEERAKGIMELLRAYDRRLDEQTIALRRMLLTHDYNTGRAIEERLPLELAPGTLSPPPKP